MITIVHTPVICCISLRNWALNCFFLIGYLVFRFAIQSRRWIMPLSIDKWLTKNYDSSQWKKVGMSFCFDECVQSHSASVGTKP